jgi:hypothetical protein
VAGSFDHIGKFTNVTRTIAREVQQACRKESNAMLNIDKTIVEILSFVLYS